MLDGVVRIPLPGQPLSCASRPDRGHDARTAAGCFIAGPENRLIEVAVRAVLEGPANGYNPLVFCGLPGTGKSHLARGLAAAWKSCHSRRRVVYTTAADFARQLNDAIQIQAVDELRQRHRTASLLVLEDIHQIAADCPHARAAQEELLHTLDALLASGRWIVLTASAAPGHLRGILAGLQSRLGAGLTVALAPPGRNARQAILLQLAAQRKVDLSESAARMLADASIATVPELLATLTRLDLAARLNHGRIDAETARRFLATRNRSPQPRVSQIAAATARHFSLRLSALRGPSRSRAIVTARGVAMYLARHLTENSLARIGQYFGRRDHTTVMHACRKTESLISTHPNIRQAVQQLGEKYQ